MRHSCDFRATFAVLVVVAATPAAAQISDVVPYNCAAYVSETFKGDTPRRREIEQWAIGFAAGWRAAARQARLTPIQNAALVKALEIQCGNAPMMIFPEAVLLELGRLPQR